MAFSIFTTAREAWFLLSHPALWLRKPLSRAELSKDPLQQFERWYSSAKKCISLEFPNAFCLSTVSEHSIPEGRIVLLKSHDADGFVFYTNSLSAKGRALSQTPHAAMTFYWQPLQRQVRISGAVSMVSAEEADAYFAKRPRGSQLSAWASLQSQEMNQDDDLEQRLKEFEQKFAGSSVPRPPHWTGFKITPRRFEFWELRFSREHDRWVYRWDENAAAWILAKLYP
jgi:pyridoxamine 5'-phosphate oxidase